MKLETAETFSIVDASITMATEGDEIEPSENNTSEVQRVIQCIIYAILTVLVISCNVFIWVLLRRTRAVFDTTTVFFYQSLAAVNMLAGICGAVYGIIMGPTSAWPLDQISCSILLRGHYLFLYQSALILCCISIDRCLMVTLPLRYPTIVTPMRAKLGLIIILVLSICPFVPILPIKGFPLKQSTTDRCDGNSFHIRGSDLAWVGFLFFFVAVPLFTTTVANACMLRTALKQRKRVRPKCNLIAVSVLAEATSATTPSRVRSDVSPTNDRRPTKLQANEDTRVSGKPRQNSELKTIRTIITMTAAYYVSWIPLTVYFVLQSSGHSTNVPKEFYFFALGVNLCACWWNAIVYVSTNVPLRNTAKDMLNCR